MLLVVLADDRHRKLDRSLIRVEVDEHFLDPPRGVRIRLTSSTVSLRSSS
jgi:hypothetical protein